MSQFRFISLVYHYLQQGGGGFYHVHLLVGLSAGLHKNYRMEFHETWMEDGTGPRTELADLDEGADSGLHSDILNYFT